MNDAPVIKYIVVHTLNYIVIELMRRAYQLAMLDELKNLDGLVDTRLDTWMRDDNDEGQLILLDDDLDLLSDVEDVGVKIVVESIHRILEANRTFQMIQSVDVDEMLMDTESSGEAAGILNTYILELKGSDSYKDILDDLQTCYTSISVILYHCMTQLNLGKIDVWEEGMDNWTSSVNNFGFEEESKDGSVVVLRTLNDELCMDAVRLSDIEL